MLGKCLKYEFKSTARIFLPLFLLIFAVALLNRIVFWIISFFEFLGFLGVITMPIYTIMLVACVAVVAVIIIQRFYKNLLGEEGYLTMTLPVSASTHILSKAITAVSWAYITILVAFLSVFIIIPSYEWVSGFPAFWNQISTQFYNESGLTLSVFILQVTALLAVIIPSGILMLYSAMAVGQLSSKHRAFSSLAAAFVMYTATQAVMIAVVIVIAFTSDLPALFSQGGIDSNMLASKFVPGFFPPLMWCSTALNAILGVVYFFLARHLIKNKLNLE